MVGKGISSSANFFKQRFLTEHAQNFEDYLIGDEKALELLKETYQSLDNAFQDNQSKLPNVANLLNFNRNKLDQHSVFKIGEFKPNENLTVDKMNQIIEALSKHLEEFIQALQQEAEQCDKEIKLLAETNGELPNEIEKLLNKLVGESEQSISAQQFAQLQKIEKTPSRLNKINNEINEIEEQITTLKNSLEDESANLAEKFTELNKKLINNRNDIRSRNEVKELHKKLKEKGVSEEKVEKVIFYCERLNNLE